jgi:hypothetical protein
MYTHESIEQHVERLVKEKRVKSAQILDPDHTIRDVIHEIATYSEDRFVEKVSNGHGDIVINTNHFR